MKRVCQSHLLPVREHGRGILASVGSLCGDGTPVSDLEG